MKGARAIGWGIGLVMLFVDPIIGVLVLILALSATIYLAREAHEAREEGEEQETS